MPPAARVNVHCPHCNQWMHVPARARWWECPCGMRLNAMQCPFCSVVDVAFGVDPEWTHCPSCTKRTDGYPDDRRSTAGAYSKTLQWRGADPKDDHPLVINGNRVISASGIELPLDRTVSMIVGADAVTLAGVDAKGTLVSVSIKRSDLLDLRLELRDEEILDGDSGLNRFTILGAGVGKAINSVINALTGHVEPSQTIITLAVEGGVTVLSNPSWTPEELDALFTPVELDISANRKRIIEEYTPQFELPEDAPAIELLNELAELHSAGVLTDEEFSRKKAQILSRI